MAFAIQKSTTVRTEVVTYKDVVKKDGVEIVLSHEEANTLALILDRVGGCPEQSARMFADSINTALRMSGYSHKHGSVLQTQGEIIFEDDSFKAVKEMNNG